MADASVAEGIGAPGRGLAGAMSAASSAVRPKLPFPVLVYLLTVVLPVAFYAGPLFMTGLRAFLLLMIVPLTYKLLMGRYDRLYATDVLFLAHAAWVAVALHVNNPDMMIENAGIYAIEFFGGYVLARAYIRGPEEFSALVRTVLLLALLTLPLAFHEAYTGRPWLVEMIRRIPGLTSVAIVTIDERMGFERVQAVFAHPIHYGLFTASVFSLTFIALKDEFGDARRIVSAGVIGVLCFMSLSSGAFLTLLMQLFLIGWAAVLGGVKQRWLILVACAAAAYVLIDLLSNRTPIRVFFSYATFSAHNAYWRGIIFEWGMKNVLGDPAMGVVGSPLFGIGLKDWVRPHFMHSGSMDNFWLVQAVRYGLPGFFTMAAGYAIVLWRIGRRDFDSDPRLWRQRRAWMFTFVGLTFTLATVHIWTSIFSYAFFLLGAGMWMLAAQPNGGAEASATADAAPARPSRYARFSQGRAAPGRDAGPGSRPHPARSARPGARNADLCARRPRDPADAAGRSVGKRPRPQPHAPSERDRSGRGARRRASALGRTRARNATMANDGASSALGRPGAGHGRPHPIKEPDHREREGAPLTHSVRWAMRDVLSITRCSNVPRRGGWAFLGRIVVPSGSASRESGRPTNERPLQRGWEWRKLIRGRCFRRPIDRRRRTCPPPDGMRQGAISSPSVRSRRLGRSARLEALAWASIPPSRGRRGASARRSRPRALPPGGPVGTAGRRCLG